MAAFNIAFWQSINNFHSKIAVINYTGFGLENDSQKDFV